MKLFPIISALVFSLPLFAQEVFVFDYSSRLTSSEVRSSLKSDLLADTISLLSLPFYEDFSGASQYPDVLKWVDNDVFINDFFTVNQPSIGVATFDALDGKGLLHPNASNSSFAADTLTSRPIALRNSKVAISNSDKAIFSFYSQVGGLNYQANMPCETDSLQLEFYYPSEKTGFFINECSTNRLEFYNASDSAFSLGQYIIRVWNDSTEYEYVIQAFADVLIQPYGHFVVDKTILDLPQGRLDFALYSGDSIVAYSPNGTISDTVLYLNTSKYNSYGRVVDGSDLFTEFTAPSLSQPNGNWVKVWGISGFSKPQDEYTGKYVYNSIDIVGPKYIVNGFRFRFTNLASLSDLESHARNCDFFNIDQIYLDLDREGIIDYPDVTFAKPMISLLKDYYTVPFSHFEARNSIYNSSVFFFRTNNFDTKQRKVKYEMSVAQLFEPYNTETMELYETDLPSVSIIDDTLNLAQFLSPIDVFLDDAGSRSTAEYKVQMYFEDDNTESHAPYRNNDTLNFIQSFSNYYAYDDGTSEAGYGVRGESNMSVAQKFTIHNQDTLRAVSMFFNPTLNDPKIPAKRFFLAVWSDEKGKPKDLLYKSPQIIGVDMNRTNLNQFQTQFIEAAGIMSGSTDLIVSGDIHIGWIQTSEFFMNVGVDLNRTSANKVNYESGNKWSVAETNNPLMIHAHVGSNFVLPTSSKSNSDDTKYSIYPSPSNTHVNVIGSGEFGVSIFSSIGLNVFKSEMVASSIDVSNLPVGVYYVHIVKGGKVVSIEPFLIQR